MSDISEALRSLVTARAKGGCEYCLLPAEGQVGRFPVDHILPRTAGGSTELENHALACPHCNAHKWSHTQGLDDETGTVVPLFHPRRHLWADHFAWADDPAFHILGLDPIGRATVARLRMNHPDLIIARRLLAALEMFPPAADPT